MIIAIDGPAASGKGTLARRLAARYALPHLDTGLLYRAVAARCLDLGRLHDPEAAAQAAQTLDPATIDAETLRNAAVGEAASVVAAIAEVRAALLDLQRRFAMQPGGAVLDGRDIGTVICPDADVKLFVTASAEVRAERRFLELQSRGEAITFADVLSDIARRDARDSARAAAPLVRAQDAVLLDTSRLGIEDAFAAALAIVEGRGAAPT